MADDKKKMDPTEKNKSGDPIPSRNQNVKDPEQDVQVDN